jgi:hypothetical protein
MNINYRCSSSSVGSHVQRAPNMGNKTKRREKQTSMSGEIEVSRKEQC